MWHGLTHARTHTQPTLRGVVKDRAFFYPTRFKRQISQGSLLQKTNSRKKDIKRKKTAPIYEGFAAAQDLQVFCCLFFLSAPTNEASSKYVVRRTITVAMFSRRGGRRRFLILKTRRHSSEIGEKETRKKNIERNERRNRLLPPSLYSATNTNRDRSLSTHGATGSCRDCR